MLYVAGPTPLLEAAKYGQTLLAELLLARGADLKARDQYGQTALELAEANGQEETADLLRRRRGRE